LSSLVGGESEGEFDGLVDQVGGEDDGEVSSAVKADEDFFGGDFHVGWHIYDVAKDLPGLSIGVAPHSLSQEPIQPAGNHHQDHIKVDLEANG
jgi:hypothetical protein